MKKFTKNTILEKVLEQEKTKNVLLKHRVPCATCPFAQAEMNRITIGEVCSMYGINLNKLLEELNQMLETPIDRDV